MLMGVLSKLDTTQHWHSASWPVCSHGPKKQHFPTTRSALTLTLKLMYFQIMKSLCQRLRKTFFSFKKCDAIYESSIWVVQTLVCTFYWIDLCSDNQFIHHWYTSKIRCWMQPNMITHWSETSSQLNSK